MLRLLKRTTIYKDFNKFIFKSKWRKLNKHNYTSVKNEFDFSKVSVGNYTYGEINANTFGDDKVKLQIGSYCSIGREVSFLLSGEHLYTKLTTYPFKKKFQNITETVSKGSVILDDDVWVGYGSTILSGVHIGQGAIVGACSLVAKDVPPYAIVGGVPAHVIKYRFSKSIIDKLLKIDFSKIDVNQIDALYEDITEDNVDEVIRKVMK